MIEALRRTLPRFRRWLFYVCGIGFMLFMVLFVIPIRERDDLDYAARIEMPPGFEITIFARGLNGPRFMAFGPDGVLYVAERGNNRIAALDDADGDDQADSIRPVSRWLRQPHSIVYHEGAWYVGIPSGIVRLTDTTGDGFLDEQEPIIDDYPPDGHRTRTVIFLPDGRMAVSIGSSCDICEGDDPRRAAVLIYDDENGRDEQVFASGLRNAVGLALQPETGDLWATNNGINWMAADEPKEAIYIVREGGYYGWPYCHNGTIIDPDIGFADACDGVERPAAELPAHAAPLGLTFYSGDQFPEAYRDDLFVAAHGSAKNTVSVPVGYAIWRLPMEDGKPSGPVEDFATGWVSDEAPYTISGRPVGIVEGPDGALYVSDDRYGYIYKIRYTGR